MQEGLRLNVAAATFEQDKNKNFFPWKNQVLLSGEIRFNT